MTEQAGYLQGTRDLIDRLKGMIPARFRPGTAVVPVVRLSGVIGEIGRASCRERVLELV